jgi:hypothetical protein
MDWIWLLCFEENEEKPKHFAEVKPMITCFQQKFG